MKEVYFELSLSVRDVADWVHILPGDWRFIVAGSLEEAQTPVASSCILLSSPCSIGLYNLFLIQIPGNS
jgi:hypothetical protein